MGEVSADPVLLGQNVVAILETGQRDATYKLATLMALIEHSIENLPEHPDDVLPVPIADLAHRVLALYWRQVRPFEGHELVQRRTGTKSRITDATKALRDAAGAGNGGLSLEMAMMRAPDAYQQAIDKIVIALAKQPLARLQKLPGASCSDLILYDDSFLGENVSHKSLREHGDAIVLAPGVAHGLARLAGLLKPALEIMWIEDVRRMNGFLREEVILDVAGHLFGRTRADLDPVREPLKEAFGTHCFYCRTHLPPSNPIDHVLPWSRVPIDGLANLVLACSRCNSDKSNALPAIPIVSRVLERDPKVLQQIASEIGWPTQYERVAAAAYGLYQAQPDDVPTWSGFRQTVRLDISFPPP